MSDPKYTGIEGSRFSMGDPSRYCEIKELRERRCDGCIHERVSWTVRHCDKGHKHNHPVGNCKTWPDTNQLIEETE